MPLDRIVIAGGGVAGWMTASALRRAVPRLSITLIGDGDADAQGDDSLGIPSHAEPALPAISEYHLALGYDEDALIRASGGTFSLGTAQSGWDDGAAPRFVPFGDVGAPMGSVGFHHLVARLRAEGQVVNPANYSVAALCAQSGRFARPATDPRSPLATYDYGLYLSTHGYAEAMKADARGVHLITAGIGNCERGANGAVSAVLTSDGRRVEGDLFIDCTGPRALLSDARFEDWQQWLPCDRAASTLRRRIEAPLPFTHVHAHGAGWRRSIPLATADAEMIVYAAAHFDEARLDAPAYAFASGMRMPWSANCVAIGGAAGMIDPVASTALSLTQSSIRRLISLLPTGPDCGAEAREYNRLSRAEWECTRDFAALFYKANARVGDPFWDSCRAAAVPDALAHRIALFENMGRTALYDGEMFEASDWIWQFDALDVQPRRYDTLATGIPRDTVTAHFARLRDVMIKAVATVPAHQAYVTQINRGHA